jgi:hypothetical protein
MSSGTAIGAAWMIDPAINCHVGVNVDGSSAKLYTGKQVLYGLANPLPAYSRITAKVTADVAGDDPRVYLLILPKGARSLPTDVPAASGCVARYNPSYNGAAVIAGWNNETASEYEVLVGVSGGQFDKGFGSTGYSVTIEIVPLEERCHGTPWDDVVGDNWWPVAPKAWADFVTELTLDEDGNAQVSGSLESGLPICDLSFAWSSQVACFPEPQAYLYETNTRFYAVTMPKAGTMTVTVTPDPGVDLSVYGLQMGTTSFYTPPNNPSATSCEQSPKKNFATVGGAGAAESLTFVSTGNPYNILIAVSAPAGIDPSKSGYTLDIAAKLVADDTCGELWSTAKLSKWPTTATQWYPAVAVVTPDANGKATVAGNLTSGKPMCSLSFAWQSNIACFPATETTRFSGNHVFYALDGGVGAGQTVTVTVTPTSADVDVSLYGYWMGLGDFYIPPKVVSVGSCEASYAKNVSGAGNPGAPETIYFENPGGNAYNYFFAVAGADAANTGAYTIDIVRTTPPPPFCPESLPGATYSAWPTSFPRIDVGETGKATLTGDLSNGNCVNLGFASSSQTACFPSTQNDNFEGKQVFYVLSEPLPPNSTLDLTLTPAPGLDMSLYGYMLGLNNYRLPPNLPSALACEASYSTKLGGNPGATEKLHFENPSDKNSYQVVIAVSGVSGVDAGAYTLEAVRKVATPYCPESLPGQQYSQWPASVTSVTVDAQGLGTATGNVEDGDCVNLGFASQSSVACFPETENDNFQGPQRFYRMAELLGPGDEVDIAVIPDPGVDVSLYGYQNGSTSVMVPPYVPTVVACEASYDAQASWNPGEPEYIHFENPTSNSYSIFFAVSGTSYSQTGGYRVEVLRKKAPPPFCPESLPGSPHSDWPASVKTVALDGNGSATVSANLNQGACTNLAFADDSSVACFPSTQSSKFNGNTVFFALAEPLPASSTASVEVIPAAGVDVSLFGYTMGLSSHFVPPYVPSVSVCEASYSTGAANPGESEWIAWSNPTGNSYNTFFAVSGVSGLTSGAFTVKVNVQTAEPHCPESLPGPVGGTSWPSSTNLLTLSGTTASANGNLSSGACTDLSFAWNPNVACFPATQSSSYLGKHVYYALSAPVPANKKVTITVTPSGGVDVGLYAYRLGSTYHAVPPALPSTAGCEASHGAGAGTAESVVIGPSSGTTPYNIAFAVAGKSGVSSGAYSVSVKVE